MPDRVGARDEPAEVATEIGRRLTTTFTEDEDGRRPVFGGIERFQSDPHWHDLLLFHEYFHGDNGAGIGASHQTGWTGTVALLLLLGDELRGSRRDDRRRRVSGRHVRLPRRPTVYEINTAVWLERLGRGADALALDEVPGARGTRSRRCRSTRCG